VTLDVGTQIEYRDLRLSLPATARPTETGIMTFGCQVSELGVKPQIAPESEDVFHSISTMRRFVNGAERWDVVDGPTEEDPVEDWILEKVAGPFYVDVGDDGLRFVCDECGWRGPWRSFDRRVLAADLQHTCFEQPQLDLEVGKCRTP
jgi:hypothetical protein